MSAHEIAEKIRQRSMEAMCKELTDLLNSRFVVSEANKEIVTALCRLAETVAYGTPRTPKRVHHHGEDDPLGLPPNAGMTRAEAVAMLTPEQKRALGL
jgi:hypothetical protein